MKFVNLFVHLFIPHESNNQKAKLLHPSGLFTISVFLLVFQAILSFTPRMFPAVLGFAAQISPSEVIRLTNEKRSASGLNLLSENSLLSQAALAKGADMLNKGYWAHFAPDGTSPWSFFTSFGYKYRYAGENLARDFSSPQAAVDAWMNSPTHRDNILNGNYKEIGIGVVEGNLAGVETTVIVQFFGTQLSGSGSIPEARAKDTSATLIPSATPKVISLIKSPTPTPTVLPTSTPNVQVNAVVSPFSSTKSISLGVVGLLLLVLSIDLIIVRRRRIMRIGGRTLAHIAYLGMILALLLILKAGQII